ncbi:MAG: hypothetical protein ACKOJF_34175, partial [Planctomycetaceae bacterium]
MKTDSAGNSCGEHLPTSSPRLLSCQRPRPGEFDPPAARPGNLRPSRETTSATTRDGVRDE